MRTESTAYLSSTVKAFLAIDRGEYKEKIQFVDHNWESIRTLPTLEYARIMDTYALALFATSNYHRHIEIADHLIQLAIDQDIREVNGKDLYFHTLFKKAASLYNLDRLAEATHILEELHRMDSHHESTRLFLINCYVKAQSPRLLLLRKISMVMISASALIIACELLLVRAFWPQLTNTFETSRNIAFVCGVCLLAAGELSVRYQAVSRIISLKKRAT